MDKDNEIVNERRREFRLSLQIRFKYRILSLSEDLSQMQEVFTKNISASGLLFENPKQIPVDTDLEIILHMPGTPPGMLKLQGRVMRIERLPSFNFDIGISFFKISQEQREEISRRIERMNIIKLLEKINKKEVSDLHLTVNSPAMVRYYGEIKPLDNEPLSAEEIKQMIYSLLSEEQKKQFEFQKDLDFAFSPSLDSRYRVSIYQQRGITEVVFRNIMPNIKSREDLGLPDVVEDLCQLKDGIVIIGGTTGSGKTTTISTMIDIINRNKSGVILSLEKPIEYLHKNMKGIVKQREVGTDVPSFAAGLKAALRQDPDVIVVGEVLDADTIETVLQAAETGHLVITSLHTADSVQVFDRIISFFPLDQRSFIYSRLSHSLKAIIIQGLLPHKNGLGRVLSTEVCIVNTAIRRIIHGGDFTQLHSVIQTGAKYKMHLMQDSIDKLFEYGLISAETYEMYAKK
jgi:twitching motility protein PilT